MTDIKCCVCCHPNPGVHLAAYVLQVDWVPPAGRDKEMMDLLDPLL